MRIGVTLPLADGDTADGRAPAFAETVAFARDAEQLGLDSIWTFDHLLIGSPGQPRTGVQEGWTTLAAVAALVPRVELGTLVMCSSFRNAGLMAKMAATLDDLSGGRLLLGLGAGWHDPEYTAFGFPTDHRVGRFAEDLEVAARLLRGERVDVAGRWSRYEGAELIPPPARRVPILVAAKGDRMLELTARWADAWNTAWFGRADDERLTARLEALDRACAAASRDPATMRRTVGVRLRDPGGSTDDPSASNASGEALADLFDAFAARGFDDVVIWAISKTRAALARIALAREIHLARLPFGARPTT